MKNLLNYSKFWALFLGLGMLFFTACDDDPEEEPTPEPTASFTFAPETPEIGEAVTFTSTSENADTFEWSFGDGNTGNGAVTTHTFEASGDFTVTLVTRGEGGNATATAAVNVSEIEPPVVYFSEADELKIRKLTQTADGAVVEDFINTTGYVVSLYFDEENNQIYYGDDDNFQIVRVNLDGSNETVIGEINSPRGMVKVGDNLYVNSRGDDAIYSIDLTDNSISELYGFEDFSANVSAELVGVLLEGMTFHDGNLYITAVDFDVENVWKASLDGSSLDLIIDYSAGGYGYSVAYNVEEDKIYFHDDESSAFFKANPDGSGIEKVVDIDDRAWGLSIDQRTARLYWSTRNGDISSSNLDGSDKQELTSGLLNPRGIFTTRK